jgi:hemerythrin-like domain-containing protein
MTFAHNAFVRTLNSILLQYEHLTSPTDIADLLIFSQCWHEMVHHHHHFEEKYLFPSIEVYSGEKGIMDGNVAQHHAFEAGLKEFGEYVYGVKAEEWDKEKFRGIVDSFAPALMKHLTEEISTLLALDKYGGEKLKVAWDDMENVIKKAPLDPVRNIYPPSPISTIEYPNHQANRTSKSIVSSQWA